MIDHDFINDTIENVLQSDAYRNIDFLTGVTLNEGLYFAEYHIKHLYSGLQNHSIVSHNMTLRGKRSAIRRDSSSTMIAPDILLPAKEISERDNELSSEARSQADGEQALNNEANTILRHFTSLNYFERYIDANFQHGKCFIDRVKERYESPGRTCHAHPMLTRLSLATGAENMIHRLELYIDLVSDLMFNYHMVRSLTLRAQASSKYSTNYGYIYSHRPTLKVRSTLRDQLKLLPNAIGHFAELGSIHSPSH